jgi:hypothetical protein
MCIVPLSSKKREAFRELEKIISHPHFSIQHIEGYNLLSIDTICTPESLM